MKIIILAAGYGSRLEPLTDKVPKCLIQVGKKTILQHQLDAIESCGLNLSDVLIVTGHLSENIEKVIPAGICTLKNELYKTTNNIYSLWLAASKISDNCLIMNSDTLFHKEILQKIISSDLEDAILLDDNKQLGSEEMKVILKNGALHDINKTMSPNEADGEYIGISKFSKQGFKILSNKLEECINSGLSNEWYEKAFLETSRNLQIYFVSTCGLPWIEIDDFEDLTKAKEIVSRIE